MSKYFLRFFIYLVLFTMLAGILAALFPKEVGQVLTAFPFLIAMILVLFRFLKNEERAPSNMERNHFSLLYVVIFFLFNYVFAVIGPLIFNLNLPNILSVWWKAAIDAQFQISLITHLLIFMIPFYLISFWFYGPQAKRMAAKMFDA
ncbi:MAG: ABZJ_00895 family protein [Acinetobacter sp.]|nr:ABZJ_00895 family protein [Acinetobacter sp.]MBP7793737.1 ABZJ_00895 family protein [Acinetobacter sp.]